MPFLASEGCLWTPPVSMTSEVKNDHAHVITQDICNKFIEIYFCVGCMVSQPNGLFQHLTSMSLINKKISWFQSLRLLDSPSCSQLYVCKMESHQKTAKLHVKESLLTIYDGYSRKVYYQKTVKVPVKVLPTTKRKPKPYFCLVIKIDL